MRTVRTYLMLLLPLTGKCLTHKWPCWWNENTVMTHPGTHRPSVLWLVQRLRTYKTGAYKPSVGVPFEVFPLSLSFPPCLCGLLLCSSVQKSGRGVYLAEGWGDLCKYYFYFCTLLVQLDFHTGSKAFCLVGSWVTLARLRDQMD